MSRDVHIVPLQREVDRAVLPFLAHDGHPPVLHAHKIILLVPLMDQGRRVALRVERALKSIAVIERHDLEADMERPTAGLQGILQQIARLCLEELEQGNRVHINLSSGSKLVAFAAGLAGMAHIRPGNGSIYYVQPGGFSLSEVDFEEHGHTKGIMDVEELELMPVLLPQPMQLRILSFLRYRPERRAAYRELLEYLTRIPGGDYASAPKAATPRVRNWNNAATTRMVRKVLAPLEEDGLIEILSAGAQKSAQLTTRGILYASIAGLDQRSLLRPLVPQNPQHPPRLVDALKP